jgi:glycosyltransferase involved in cell wall biosynthesis
MSEEKPIFSIGLIVKNEELTIPKLYKCIEDFIKDGGEAIILDTGSSDNTMKVAQELGFKVYKAERSFVENLSNKSIKKIRKTYIEDENNLHENSKSDIEVERFQELIKGNESYFNFGRARNELHKYASNDILFQLDGSDTLCAFDYKYINAQIKSGIRRFEYTQIYGPVELTISRFYDKSVDVWEGRIHEILTHKSNNKIARLSKDHLAVIHNYQHKKRTYLSGLFADLLENPNHTRTLYYLGRELMFSGLYRCAIKMLRKYIDRPDCWIPERSSAYCLIGNCYENMGREYYQEAFRAYNDGFIAFNGWREPLLRMARLCQRTDEFQRGLCYTMASLSINRMSAFAEPMCNYMGLPHEIAYWGYHFTGRHKEASTHWKIAITLEPHHEKYINDTQYFDKPQLFDEITLQYYLRK